MVYDVWWIGSTSDDVVAAVIGNGGIIVYPLWVSFQVRRLIANVNQTSSVCVQ